MNIEWSRERGGYQRGELADGAQAVRVVLEERHAPPPSRRVKPWRFAVYLGGGEGAPRAESGFIYQSEDLARKAATHMAIALLMCPRGDL